MALKSLYNHSINLAFEKAQKDRRTWIWIRFTAFPSATNNLHADAKSEQNHSFKLCIIMNSWTKKPTIRWTVAWSGADAHSLEVIAAHSSLQKFMTVSRGAINNRAIRTVYWNQKMTNWTRLNIFFIWIAFTEPEDRTCLPFREREILYVLLVWLTIWVSLVHFCALFILKSKNCSRVQPKSAI